MLPDQVKRHEAGSPGDRSHVLATAQAVNAPLATWPATRRSCPAGSSLRARLFPSSLPGREPGRTVRRLGALGRRPRPRTTGPRTSPLAFRLQFGAHASLDHPRPDLGLPLDDIPHPSRRQRHPGLAVRVEERDQRRQQVVRVRPEPVRIRRRLEHGAPRARMLALSSGSCSIALNRSPAVTSSANDGLEDGRDPRVGAPRPSLIRCRAAPGRCATNSARKGKPALGGPRARRSRRADPLWLVARAHPSGPFCGLTGEQVIAGEGQVKGDAQDANFLVAGAFERG